MFLILNRLFESHPTVAFDSLIQLVHSAMSAEQRMNLLTTLNSLQEATVKSDAKNE